MNRELKNSVKVGEAIRPAVFSGNATGVDIDTRGFDSALFAIAVAAIAGAGNMTITVQESDVGGGSGYTNAAAADVEGTIANPVVTNTAYSVAYKGSKRYIRLFGTLNSGTSVALGANVILGHPSIKPTE